MDFKRMKGSKHLTASGGALALGMALSGNLLAVPLFPNETLINPDLPPSANDFFTNPDSPAAIGGGLYVGVDTLLASNIDPMVGAFSGSMESRVYGDSAGSPAQLLFVYQFAMDQDANDPDLIRATIGDASNPWAGFSILDAGADGSGASGTAPEDEWFDGDPNFLLRDPGGTEGVTIQWRALDIGTTLQEDDTSSLIWYLVNANDFTTTNVGLLDSGSVGTSTAFAPLAVPELSTTALLGLGLAGLVIRRRRKETT